MMPTLAGFSEDLRRAVAGAEFTDFAGRLVDPEEGLFRARTILEEARRTKSAVYLVGNGGSAATASHAANDFMNMGHLRAMTLTDPALMTCMANDYGYDCVYSEPLSRLIRPGDVLVAISSSGHSPNVLNAVKLSQEEGAGVLTLSGFAPDNVLRSLGDVNIWLPSECYGHVEVGHVVVLHHLANLLKVDRTLTLPLVVSRKAMHHSRPHRPGPTHAQAKGNGKGHANGRIAHLPQGD